MQKFNGPKDAIYLTINPIITTSYPRSYPMQWFPVSRMSFVPDQAPPSFTLVELTMSVATLLWPRFYLYLNLCLSKLIHAGARSHGGYTNGSLSGLWSGIRSRMTFITSLYINRYPSGLKCSPSKLSVSLHNDRNKHLPSRRRFCRTSFLATSIDPVNGSPSFHPALLIKAPQRSTTGKLSSFPIPRHASAYILVFAAVL